MATLTQSDIAKKVGVSRKAVAFALSTDPLLNQKLRTDTRQRILTAVQQMGYVPHNAARRLARTRTMNRASNFDQIGLVYFNPTGSDLDLGFLGMMSGAEHELSNLHASMTFVRVSEGGDWAKVDRLARSDGVDGWLVVGQVDDGVADRLNAFGQPFVIVGDSCCTQPVPHVDVDNFAVGRLAAQHLASLGHRRIAYLTSTQRFAYQRLILDGFRAAVKELGLEEDERLFGHIMTWERRDGIAMLEWMLKLDPVPTALFAPEIAGTVELCRLVHTSRDRIPRGISLLGLDLTPPMRISQGITRVDLPIHEMGKQAVLLLHRLASGSAVEKIEMKLSPTLAEEGTTAPPGTLGTRTR